MQMQGTARPSLLRLRGCARTVAVARWLHRRNLPGAKTRRFCTPQRLCWIFGREGYDQRDDCATARLQDCPGGSVIQVQHACACSEIYEDSGGGSNHPSRLLGDDNSEVRRLSTLAKGNQLGFKSPVLWARAWKHPSIQASRRRSSSMDDRTTSRSTLRAGNGLEDPRLSSGEVESLRHSRGEHPLRSSLIFTSPTHSSAFQPCLNRQAATHGACQRDDVQNVDHAEGNRSYWM